MAEGLWLTADSLSLGSIAYFHSDSASTTSRHLVRIENHNVAAVNARCLYIEDDAEGIALEIYKGSLKIGGGKGLDIYNGGDLKLWSGSNLELTTGNVLIVSGKIHFADGTGKMTVPRVTTAQRDAGSPTNGDVIYNTSLNRFEWYENNAWTTKT